MKLLFAILFMFIPTLLLAQDAMPELAEVPEFLTNLNGQYDSLVLQYMAQYPLLGKIILILGSLRLIFKPINSLAWYFVNLSEDKDDDELFKAVRGNKFYGIFAFLLDFSASIKAKNPKE